MRVEIVHPDQGSFTTSQVWPGVRQTQVQHQWQTQGPRLSNISQSYPDQ